MIDQERVREMTKLAAYEEHEGKRYRQVKQFYRIDFAGRHILKGFFCATIVFAIFIVLWGACHLEELLYGWADMDLVGFGIGILVKYVVFLAAYLIAVDIYANVFYAAGKRSLKRYYRHLRQLSRLYAEQERRTAPLGTGGENDDIIGS